MDVALSVAGVSVMANIVIIIGVMYLAFASRTTKKSKDRE